MVHFWCLKMDGQCIRTCRFSVSLSGGDSHVLGSKVVVSLTGLLQAQAQKLFQMLIDIEDRDQLTAGLFLPNLFRSRLTPKCTSIKLVNFLNQEFVVCVERGPRNQCFLCLGQWPQFVNEMIYNTCQKLCLRLIGMNTFKVICFNEDGVEYTEDKDGEIVMNSFIVKASYETYTNEFAPSGFLDHLNVELTTMRGGEVTPKPVPDKRIRIIGSKQHGKVKVIFKWEEDLNEWKACGFEGAKWTNICFENDVESGYTLMFSKIFNKKEKELELTLDVFNSANLGLGFAEEGSEEEFMEMVSDEECELLNDPDGCDFSHECRVPLHKHKIHRPHFFWKLKHSTLTHNLLTIDKDMAEEFQLNQYSKAFIHFGKIQFSAVMRTKIDKRVIGSQNHVVMAYDWSQFAEQLGIVEGDAIRFQLNLKKCVPGVSVDFDVC